MWKSFSAENLAHGSRCESPSKCWFIFVSSRAEAARVTQGLKPSPVVLT